MENRQLYRSRDDRWIAGVCGGLAKHFAISTALARWIFVLACEVLAPIYILMWIMVPEESFE